MTKTKILLTYLAIITLLGTGCTKQNVTTNQNKNTNPIKIGAIIMQTGVAAQYGSYQTPAIQMAVEEINAQGGLLGRKIQMVFEDTKCDAKEGAAAATKLINSDQVDILIGFECSGPTFSAAPVTIQSNKIFIVTGATAPDLAKKGENIFRIIPSDIAQGKDLAKAIEAKKYGRVAILYVNTDYGMGIKTIFSQNYSGKIVATESITADSVELKTQITKIKQQTPDAILLALNGSQYQIALKQLKEIGMNAQIFGTENMKIDNLLTDKSSIAEGSYLTSYAAPSTTARQQFINKFKIKYSSNPQTYADFAYDAVMVAAQAIKNAGSLDPQKLISALKQLKYDGATGLNQFDADGEVVGKPTTLYVVKNGQFVEDK